MGKNAFGGELAEQGPSRANDAGSTILDRIRRNAEERPSSPAFVSQGVATIDYMSLVLFLDDAAEALAEAGCGPHTRVGLVVPPGLRGALMVVAVASQAQLVPLNPALPSAELREQLNHFAVD